MEKIKALEVEGTTINAEHAATLARMFNGDWDLFRFMDEKPGAFDQHYGQWFWKLRQARNNHRIFFEILNGTAK